MVRRDLRWVPGLAATGGIAIGTTETSTLTTTIISTETRTGTLTAVRLGKATGGSITRNTGEMRHMETGERRINSDKVEEVRAEEGPGAELVVRVALVEPVVRVALAEPAVPAALVVPEDPVEPVVPEDPAEPVVRAALVVLENPVEPVVRAALVVPENPVEPELVFAQVAVARRTKSVTAAHHRGLVRLAVEDLAVAVAETTREPAAAGAGVAWEAADTAAAVAAVG